MLYIYSIITSFIVFYTICYLVGRYTSISIEVNHNSRFNNIDGLRGIAAFLVLTHHSILSYQNALTGKWSFPDLNDINALLLTYFKNSGPLGVILFFMITAFLFADKIIRSHKLDVTIFYWRRFLRIAPLYYFSIAVIIVASLFFTLNMPSDSKDAFKKFFGWLAFYFIPYEGFTKEFPYSRLNGGVFWTLAIEWKFYILLPLLSVFFIKRSITYSFITIIFIIVVIMSNEKIISKMDCSIIISFILGSASALLANSDKICKILSNHAFSLASIMITLYLLFYQASIYTPFSVMLAALPFIITSCGNNLFKILAMPSLKVAGIISYSVYLLHAIIFNLVNYNYWEHLGYAWATITSVILVALICPMTYIYIERPFLAKKQIQPT